MESALATLEKIQADVDRNRARRQEVRLVDGVDRKLARGDVIQQGDV